MDLGIDDFVFIGVSWVIVSWVRMEVKLDAYKAVFYNKGDIFKNGIFVVFEENLVKAFLGIFVATFQQFVA